MQKTFTPERATGVVPGHPIRSSLLRCWRFLLLAGLLAGTRPARAQSLENLAVQVSAEALPGAGGIQLTWVADAQATQYTIHRGITKLADLPGTSTTYTDSTAQVGQTYTYSLSKTSNGYTGTGFLIAGQQVPLLENRGTLVLLVDATHAGYLAADIERLQRDLVGDGWRVLRHDVAPTLTPPQVKALILADYRATRPGQPAVGAVLLLGHVAVPYSGALNPDGHAEHYGAWPADLYYGELDDLWTDNQINTTSASRPANRNVPGDGKFDKTQLSTEIRLQVGRVDLADLPAFALPERDLLRRYLQKDHDYRHKVFAVPQRGLIDDNFGVNGSQPGEDYANNGWRNFAPLCGSANVAAGDYFGTLRTQPYSWAYGCGPGYYNSVAGVGTTADFAAGPVLSVFNMLFGSYLGDWDNTDNVLRAPLAAEGYALTSSWGARPGWQLQHMGLGQTIGFALRYTQTYSGSPYGNRVHVALLGDPTLRQHVVAPAADLTAAASSGVVALTWTASPEASEGYYVYRATTTAGPFQRLTPQPLPGPTFTDATPLPGPAVYQVRALALTTGGSGSYHNQSQGIFADFAPPLPAGPAVWLGTTSTDWHDATNWSTGTEPTATDIVSIAAGTPYAPQLTGAASAAELTLASRAQLTIAPGGTLTVPRAPHLLAAGSGQAATSLVLASGTATAPGGRLVLTSYGTTKAGLTLPAGTTLTVGDYAELQLMGDLTARGGTVVCGLQGRLTFAPDPNTYGRQHTLAPATALPVGVLAVPSRSDTLALSGPLQVLNQVRNLGVIVTNDQLTLQASPGRQAILAPVMPTPTSDPVLGTYVGKVRIEVYLDGSRNAGAGYRHLSAPVRNQTVASLATSTFFPVVNAAFNTVGNTVRPFPTVFSYAASRIGAASVPGATGFDQGWRSPAALTEVLAPGAGYAVNMPANTTLSYSGTVVLGTFLSAAMQRGADGSSWQLLGNPFAAPLDWDAVAKGPTLNLGKALYVFKSSGPYTGTYASYLPAQDTLASVSVNGGTNVVPVGQAFFIRQAYPALQLTRLAFQVRDLLATSEVASIQRPAADPRPRLVLALRNAAGTQAHQTAMYFQAGATAGPDDEYDAAYATGPGQPLTLTTAGSDGAFYSINGLPALTGADVAVPLQLQAATAGSYALAVDALHGLPTGYYAYLRDAVAGTYTDLLTTPSVAVTLAANTPVGSRYSVLFTKQLRGVLATVPAALAELVTLAPNPAHDQALLTVPRALRSQATTTVLLLNSLGQELARYQFGPAAPNALPLPLAGLAAGLYIVQVSTPAGPVSRRLVVE